MALNVEQFSTDKAKRFRQRIFAVREKGGIPHHDYGLEIECFAQAPFGSIVKHEYLLNLFRFQWPDLIVLEKDGHTNTFAHRLARACCRYRKLNVIGCASSGKSFLIGAYCYTFWKTSPWDTSVYLSSTTLESLNARIWRYVKNLHEADKFKMGVRLDYRNTIVLQEDKNDKNRDYGNAISGIAMKEGSDGTKALAAISGRKNRHVLWACDEASHMNVDILEGRLNLYANPFFQFISMSNKPSEGDPVYLDAEPVGDDFPDGWKSVHPDLPGWPTKGGYCMYLDGEKSPNLGIPDESKPLFPGVMTRQMLTDIESVSGGRDSPGYWTQARGFPKSGELQDTVLNGTLISDRGADKEPLWGASSPQVVAGLDLGFREGGDPCVASFARLGHDHDGTRILAYEPDTVQLIPKLSDKMPFEDQIANAFLDECKTRDCHDAALDISGDGGIIAAAIERIARQRGYAIRLVLVSFLGSPDEDAEYEVGGKRKPARELFDRRVSELWYSLRYSVQNGVIRGMKMRTRGLKQLCERKVIQDEKKRWSVERKKDMKKRIKRSPDDGDAMVLAHHLACRKGLSGSGKAQKKPVKPPERPVQRPPVYGGQRSRRALYSG